MKYDKNEVRAGAVILVSTVLLITLVFLVGDFRRFFSEYYYVDAIFDTVQGLPSRAPVIQRGIEVGSVLEQETAEVEGGRRRVRVRMKIRMRSEVTTGSVAKITQVGFLNRPFVSLIEPSEETGSGALPKVQDPLAGQVPTITGEGLSDFSEIAERTEMLMKQLMETTLPKVNETIDAVHGMVGSATMREHVQGLLEDLHRAGERVDGITGRVDEMLQANLPKIDRSLDHVEKTTETARRVSEEALSTVQHVDAKAGVLLDDATALVREVRPDVRAAVKAVREAAEGLSQRIDDVHARVAKLLDDTDETVVHLGGMVDDATAFMRTGRDLMVENQDEIRVILKNLEETSFHLESLIRQLDDAPSRIFFDHTVRDRTVPQRIELPEDPK